MFIPTSPQQWLERFTAWAGARTDVRAALVVGSRGRSYDHPVDEWSDVDVAFITTRPELYTGNNTWMHDIAPLWTGVMSPEETFGDFAPIFCGFSTYAGGLNVDFFILSNSRTRWMTRVLRLLNQFRLLRQWLPSRITNLGGDMRELLHDGVQVLLDKDGLAEQIRQATLTIPIASLPPPPQHVLQHDIDDFWVGPPRMVANLRRGHLPAAMKTLASGNRRVLRWIEWHARAKTCWKDDTVKYRLKSISHWADPRALGALPRIHAHYDANDLWRALFEIMDLFHWLSTETTDLLEYDCSFEAGLHITAWVKQCFTGNDS